MMAAYFMTAKDGAHDAQRDGFIMRGYLWLVRTTTAVPRLFGIRLPVYYLTMVVAVAVVIGSVQLMMQIPGNLFPPDDESRFPISVELPPGATLADTDRTTQAMLAAIRDVPGIENVLVIGGTSPLGDVELRRANMVVLLEKRDVTLERKIFDIAGAIPPLADLVPEPDSHGRTVPQAEIEAEVFRRLAAIPDIRAYKLGGPGPGGRPLSYNVLSTDESDLNAAVATIEEALAGEPLMSNVSTDGTLPRPEIQITPRLDEAARLGITTQAIGTTIRVATMGESDAALAKLSIDNRLIPIRVRLNDASREDLDRIANLKLTTSSGALVPLSTVADIRVSEGPAQIKRLNRERVATVGADLPVGVALDNATKRFDEVVFGNAQAGIPPLALPATVSVKPSGDAEVQQELVAAFGDAMIMGPDAGADRADPAVQLGHPALYHPAFAAAGGRRRGRGLLLTQNPLSMPVLIGILMLMGIVTKNAILLIDFAIEMRPAA
jgi:multidrug efflux pump subunit AcrB